MNFFTLLYLKSFFFQILFDLAYKAIEFVLHYGWKAINSMGDFLEVPVL